LLGIKRSSAANFPAFSDLLISGQPHGRSAVHPGFLHFVAAIGGFISRRFCCWVGPGKVHPSQHTRRNTFSTWSTHMNTTSKFFAAAVFAALSFNASAMTVVKAEPITVVAKRVQVVKAEPIIVIAKAPATVQVAKATSKAKNV
jgi:hypothetical protein